MDCRFKYPGADSHLPSISTVVVTVVIIIVTLTLEACCWPSEQTTWDAGSRRNSDLEDAPPPYPGEPSLDSEITDVEENFAKNGSRNVALAGRHHSQPSPKERATAFVIATLLIVPICGLFAYRIKGTHERNPVEFDSFCMKKMGVVGTSWWGVFIFNIVPLVCACTAWLRVLIDCILVRRNKSLTKQMWPPFLPITLTFRLVLKFRDAVLCFMLRGRKTDGSRKTKIDVEMNDQRDVIEERQELMRGEGSMDDDDATVYDPRSSDEQSN